MVIVVVIIGYILFQLYEMNREQGARHVTVEEFKAELASHNQSTEKYMG